MALRGKAVCGLICLWAISYCFAQSSQTFEFPTAAVSADNGPCAQLGVDLLQQGGNAIDAAIGTTICLGTLQGFASGIGGGAVALFYNAETKDIQVFDFREFAPGAASQNMYQANPNESQYGGKAIAVPGFIAGVWKMWSDYGQLSWREILEPNIALAENSTVNSLLAETIQEEKASILGFPGLREIFAPGGKLLVEGDPLVQPALANTLRAIQEDPMSFYYGQLAEDLIQDIQDAGGIMTMSDLDHYWKTGVVVRHPVSTYYQGYKVVGAPPPYTGGLCMSLALNLLEPYNFPMMTNTSSLAQHYMIEAWKWAYSDRMAIGDPSFVDQSNVISAMLSKDHAAQLRQKFSSTTTYPPSHYQDLVSPVEASIFDAGTSHMSVVDGAGNIVAMTSTVNLSFGSKVLSPLTGVILNNEMDDFSSPNQTNYFGQPPSEANYIAPFKKPISSMTPTIVTRFRVGL